MKTNYYISIILLTLLVTISYTNKANAQTPDWLWAKSMGGADSETGISTVVLFGNVYTTGYFLGTVDFDPGPGTFSLTSAGNTDIFITKTDASGNFIWAKRMGGTGQEALFATTIDGRGNVYTTGFFKATADFDPGTGVFNLTTSSAQGDAFISKLDNNGNFVWAKKIGGATNNAAAGGYCIALDTAGNVFTAGSFTGTIDFNPGTEIFNISSVGTDMFISKLNAEGNFVWVKILGGGGNLPNAMAIDFSGNIYTACHIVNTVDFDPGTGIFNLTAPAGNYSGVISKLDASGNFVWAKQMDRTEISSLAIDTSNNVYTTGYYSDTVDFDPGASIFNLASAGSIDIFISKLNSSGDFVFAKGMGGTSADKGIAIVLDNDANIYTTGDFQGTADFDPGTGSFRLSSNGSDDIFVSKSDKLGNFIWVKTFGGTGADWGNSIALDELSNIYLLGDFSSPSISFATTTLTNADNSGTFRDIFIARLGNNTTGIERVVKNEDGFSVYPNPTHGKFTISGSGKASPIEVYNLSGARVYVDFNSNKQIPNEIDLSGYAKGIYLVKIYDGTKIQSRKIIVQ